MIETKLYIKDVMVLPSKVVVFGAGYFGKIAIALSKHYNVEVEGVFDNDMRKWGQKIFGEVICEPVRETLSPILLAVENKTRQENILQQLDSMGIRDVLFMDFEGVDYFLSELSDKEFLDIRYYLKFDKMISWENPRTYNEKLQWLKLYDRRPEYSLMVDKYEVKQYVTQLIGEEYVVPTLGVWDKFEDIDIDSLPSKFVLKCTHDSGSIIICEDKEKFDCEKAKEYLTDRLKVNYYFAGREWPYKNVKPRIIAEEYIGDERGINDYKIFNFGGNQFLIQVDYNRFTCHKRNLYTTTWDYLDASIEYPNDASYVIEKPKVLDKMLELAKKLSAGMIHVRTDFYCLDDRILFGELTLYHGAGFESFSSTELENKLGELIVI